MTDMKCSDIGLYFRDGMIGSYLARSERAILENSLSICICQFGARPERGQSNRNITLTYLMIDRLKLRSSTFPFLSSTNMAEKASLSTSGCKLQSSSDN